MTSLNRFARSANVSINGSRAAAPRIPDDPRRADRAAKSTSAKPGATPVVATRAGQSKADRPGNRFAHFAGMTTVTPIADEPVLTDINPSDVAAFVMASAAKARGRKPPAAAAKPPGAAKADMSTPEGVAAFVAASAAKVRGPSR